MEDKNILALVDEFGRLHYRMGSHRGYYQADEIRLAMVKNAIHKWIHEHEELEEAQRWIPVTFGIMPDYYGPLVEFKDKNGNIYKGTYNCGFIVLIENGTREIKDVIAWRPLESEKELPPPSSE